MQMTEVLPTVLIPGLACSARLYAAQVSELWRHGPVLVADHRGGDSMAALAEQILATAPVRFNLVGLSMGGYISFEILRRSPERVARLALLDTTARPDTPEQTERRTTQIGLAADGKFVEVVDMLYPLLFSAARQHDTAMRELSHVMARECGADAFVRQQTAIMGRPDSRPDLVSISCPTLVLVGEEDQLTPPDRAEEMAEAIPDARLVAVADCGHLSTLDQPEAVNAALTWWLSS